MATIQEELAYRASRGEHPLNLASIEGALKSLGYRLDRSLDARCLARYMTGERAGESYPCVTPGISELDSGKSAFDVDARRDNNFKRLQQFRQVAFAKVGQFILEL